MTIKRILRALLRPIYPTVFTRLFSLWESLGFHITPNHFKPKKIIEIGSGYSTYLSAQAILKNEEENGNKTELIAIEPYPDEVLKSGFSGLSKLILTKIEEIDLSEFNELKENDILFIDSSHVLKIGESI